MRYCYKKPNICRVIKRGCLADAERRHESASNSKRDSKENLQSGIPREKENIIINNVNVEGYVAKVKPFVYNRNKTGVHFDIDHQVYHPKTEKEGAHYTVERRYAKDMGKAKKKKKQHSRSRNVSGRNISHSGNHVIIL